MFGQISLFIDIAKNSTESGKIIKRDDRGGGVWASGVKISKLTVTYFMDDHKNIQRKISKLVKKDVTKYIQQQKYEKNMHMIFRFVA